MFDVLDRAKEEVTRINRIGNRQIARKQKPQEYTIKNFINEVMPCNFTSDYLRRKLTSQKSKKGEDSNKKEMHETDKRRLISKLKTLLYLIQVINIL